MSCPNQAKLDKFADEANVLYFGLGRDGFLLVSDALKLIEQESNELVANLREVLVQGGRKTCIERQ